MKQTRNLINGLVAVVAMFALAVPLAAQTQKEGSATVIRVKGPARYTTGNNIWQPLKVGAVLKPGTIIQTGNTEGSFVDLVLGEAGEGGVPRPAVYQPFIPNSYPPPSTGYQSSAGQNVVRVWQNSALGIDKLTSTQTGADTVTETQLDLRMGRVTGNVKKMSSASKYEVKLPNGVAGIRGTLFDIYAEGIVKVRIGSVVLAWVNPKTGEVVTQVVGGGQSYDARTGQVTPLSPTDLQGMDKISYAMRYVVPAPMTTMVNDRTIAEVSPVGTPAGHGP